MPSSERQAIATQIVVDTPDPYINAAAAALCVAADGDVGRRGSRPSCTARSRGASRCSAGAASTGAMRWASTSARASTSTTGCRGRTTTRSREPFPPRRRRPTTSSRNETALHSNGDLTRSHYDMNMVAIDALFRHLLWTGDVEYARAGLAEHRAAPRVGAAAVPPHVRRRRRRAAAVRGLRQLLGERRRRLQRRRRRARVGDTTISTTAWPRASRD